MVLQSITVAAMVPLAATVATPHFAALTPGHLGTLSAGSNACAVRVRVRVRVFSPFVSAYECPQCYIKTFVRVSNGADHPSCSFQR